MVTGETVEAYREKFRRANWVPVTRPAPGLTVYISSIGPIDIQDPGKRDPFTGSNLKSMYINTVEDPDGIVMFTGIENMGEGVVADRVSTRSDKNCAVPG